jgi:hypothetical protein
MSELAQSRFFFKLSFARFRPELHNNRLPELRLRAYLAEGRPIISHLGWRAPEHAPKHPVHMALIAKSRLVRDVRAPVTGLA